MKLVKGSSKLGERRFRAIAKSVLRAGLKSIPYVGASLDELAFGSADEIGKQELESSLREAVDLLRAMQQRLDSPATTIVALLEAVRRDEGAQLRALVKSLSELTPEAESLFSRWLVDQFTAGVETLDLKELEALAAFQFDEVYSSLLGEIGESETEVIERLEFVESLLSEAHEEASGQVGMERALLQLGQSDQTLVLARRANYSAEQIELFRLAEETLVTVDFSLLYSYAQALAQPELGVHYAIYLFERSNQTLYLLPGAIMELKNFLNRLAINLVDDWGSWEEQGQTQHSRSSISLQSRPTLSLSMLHQVTSPATRILALLRSGRVKFWESNGRLGREQVFREILSRLDRLKESPGNLHDASSLSCLVGYNDGAVASGRPIAFHVARNRKLLRACQGLKARLPSTNHQTWSLIRSPLEHSIQTFLESSIDREFSDSMERVGRFGRHARRIGQIAEFATEAAVRIRVDGQAALQGILTEIAQLQNSAAAMYLFLGPLFDDISATASESLAADYVSFGERDSVEASYAAVMSDLAELFRLVDRAHSSAKESLLETRKNL